MSQAPLAEDHFSRAGGALSVVFAALPIAAIAGGLGLAGAAVIGGVIAAPWQRLLRAVRAAWFPLALLTAFLAWAALSLIWSSRPEPAQLNMVAFGLFTNLLVFGAGFERQADLAVVQRAALAGLVVSLAMIAIETRLDYPIGRATAPPAPGGAGYAREIETGALLARAQQALTITALWLWPVLAMLRHKSWPGWIGMALLGLSALWLCQALPNLVILIALGVGLMAALPALRWPRQTVSLTGWTIAAALVAAPGAAANLAALTGQIWRLLTRVDPPFSWLARVDTWSYVTGLIREKPIWGWGLGASSEFTETHSLAGFSTPYIPGHPQSMPMQIWLETGAVGAVLAAAALAAFGRRAGAALAERPWAAAAATGAMSSAFVIAAIGEFDLWAVWWWAGLAICAAMVRVSRGAP